MVVFGFIQQDLGIFWGNKDFRMPGISQKGKMRFSPNTFPSGLLPGKKSRAMYTISTRKLRNMIERNFKFKNQAWVKYQDCVLSKQLIFFLSECYQPALPSHIFYLTGMPSSSFDKRFQTFQYILYLALQISNYLPSTFTRTFLFFKKFRIRWHSRLPCHPS